MPTLREHIAHARANHKAIGHFNVSTMDGLWAVADAAQEMQVPVIVGLSEGERDYFGVRQAVAVVRSIRKERKQSIFLNADHTYSFERVRQAIDAGFDSVIFDGAALALEENIALTKKCIEYARSAEASLAGEDIENQPAGDGQVLIEGEIGFIGTSSKVHENIPEGAAVTLAQMTKPEDAARFVAETGVDLLAPAVGNIHGLIRGGDPALNRGLVKLILEAINIPLVLHGASGNTAEDIRACIENGIAIVHVNTELRLAYRSALVKSLSDDHEEISPYKYLKPAKIAMQKVVEEKLKIFIGPTSVTQISRGL
ncbi:MAG: class II fructose-bisphosphate aldolase [Candidatus Paceibacterota bacterium]